MSSENNQINTFFKNRRIWDTTGCTFGFLVCTVWRLVLMHRDLYPDEGKRRKPFLNMEMDLKTATSTMEALVRISVSICLFACVVAGYMAYQIRGFFLLLSSLLSYSFSWLLHTVERRTAYPLGWHVSMFHLPDRFTQTGLHILHLDRRLLK